MEQPTLLENNRAYADILNNAMKFNFKRDPSVKTKSVSFSYVKKAGSMPERRRVVPYTSKDNTILQGHDLDRDAFRAFKMSGVSNLVEIENG